MDTKEKLEQCKKALNTTASDVVYRGIDKVYEELENKEGTLNVNFISRKEEYH